MTTRTKHSIEGPEIAPVGLDQVIAELRLLGTSDRLLGLYELGIDGCANRQASQVTTVVHELLESLDYEYADIADGFRRVYEYCLHQAGEEQLDGVAFILQDLRDTLMRAVTDSAGSDAESAERRNGNAAGA
jgi:hypothetical protein